MGEIDTAVRPVKMIVGILFDDEQIYEKALRRLALDFGALDLRSEIIPFTFTDYYREEMGDNLRRQWVSIGPLIRSEQLAKVKAHTNRLEQWLTEGAGEGTEQRSATDGRLINLDPGYLDLAKLVLASTKDFSHRVPVGQGIYAEVTLRWRRNQGFEACGDWTYPDYVSSTANDFLNQVRQNYLEQLRPTDAAS